MWRPEEIKVERSKVFNNVLIFGIYIGRLCIYYMQLTEDEWQNQGGE